MFQVIKNCDLYDDALLNHAARHTNMNMDDPEELIDRWTMNYPETFPCLVQFYSTWFGTAGITHQYITALSCSRKVAKTVVYPDTNPIFSDSWIKTTGAELYAKRASYLKALYNCGIVNHIDFNIMQSVIESKQPYLVGHMVVTYSSGLKVLTLVPITKSTAKEVVYYKQNKYGGQKSGSRKIMKARQRQTARRVKKKREEAKFRSNGGD